MGEALLWGLFAGSSLIIGGVLALAVRLPQRVLGLIMAFGAGVLVSAVAFELVEDAVRTDEFSTVAIGLLVGSLVFFGGNSLIDRMGGAERKRSMARQASGTGLAIALGTVLDGIPESAVIGLGLIGGGTVSLAVIVAVFLSNLPESIAATTSLRQSGWSVAGILGLWSTVAAASGLASLAGYAFFGNASTAIVAFVLAFAAGAILTMLADTMFPEAYEHGGRLVGVATTLGFAAAAALSALE